MDLYQALGLYFAIGVAVLLALPFYAITWLYQLLWHEDPYNCPPKSVFLFLLAFSVVILWPAFVVRRGP